MSAGRVKLLIAGIVLCSPGLAHGVGSAGGALKPFFGTYCASCHDADVQKGGLDVTAAVDLGRADELARWTRLYDRVAKGEMPPANKRQPGAADKASFLDAHE